MDNNVNLFGLSSFTMLKNCLINYLNVFMSFNTEIILLHLNNESTCNNYLKPQIHLRCSRKEMLSLVFTYFSWLISANPRCCHRKERSTYKAAAQAVQQQPSDSMQHSTAYLISINAEKTYVRGRSMHYHMLAVLVILPI